MSSMSKFDSIYRNILLGKFFTKGWGDISDMKRIFKFRKIISNRATCQPLVSSDYPVYIDVKVEQNSSYSVYEGHLLSPLVQYLDDLVPKESHISRFQILLPNKWTHSSLKPMCLHIAGTGDHFYWRRRALMAKPLLKEYGIGSIILENPYYGSRKPKEQSRSSLRNVSDIFIMGGCLILESLALLHWCERMNYGPLCITGISMGGHNASLAGTNWHKPIAIVPCLSWSTASCVFTQGVMSSSVNWDVLEDQYSSFDEQCRTELRHMLVSPEKNNMIFDAGRHFAKTFPSIFDSFFNSDILPKLSSKLSSNGNNKNGNGKNNVQAKNDAFNFMRGIMDECTHIGNFSTPVDPELAVIVNARKDGYVLTENLIPLTQLWKGSTARYLDCGHVAACIFHLDVFRKAIVDALELTAQKYYATSLFGDKLMDKSSNANSNAQKAVKI